MVQAHRVTLHTGGQWSDLFYYLWEERASAHVQAIKDHPDDRAWIDEVEIDSLPEQRVVLHGNVIGYQFSRTKAGKRTIIRTVRKIERRGDGFIGVIVWDGRELAVSRLAWWCDWATSADLYQGA